MKGTIMTEVSSINPISSKVVILTTADAGTLEIVRGMPPMVPEETTGTIIKRKKPMNIKIGDTISFKGYNGCQPLVPTGPIKTEEKNVFKVLPTGQEGTTTGTKINFLA